MRHRVVMSYALVIFLAGTLIVVGAWFLHSHHRRARPLLQGDAFLVGVGDEFPILGRQVLIDDSAAALLIARLRIKLSFPAEVFARAACPLIEGVAEYVQRLPAPGCDRDVAPGTIFTHAIELVLIVLDYRRGQILPRGAPPEVIGAQAHRWTYALFVAALLYDVDAAIATLRVNIRRPAGALELWAPLAGALSDCGALSYRVDHEAPSAVSYPQGALAALLLNRYLPPSILTWLAEDGALFRELLAFIGGDQAAHSGALGALIGRAHAERSRRTGATTSETQSGCGSGVSTSVTEPAARGERAQDPIAASLSTKASPPTPPQAGEAALQVLPRDASVESGIDRATMLEGCSSRVRSAATGIHVPEYLDDFDQLRTEKPSAIAVASPLNAQMPSVHDTHSSLHPIPVLQVSGAATSVTARRFMHWLAQGLADRSIPVNESGAMVHAVPEGLLLVSPRIFREFARVEAGRNAHALCVAREQIDRSKDIQREVLRARWHIHGEKNMNILTYQVLRGDRAVSRLAGVVIRDPERFVNPVPPVNRLLVRLAADQRVP